MWRQTVVSLGNGGGARGAIRLLGATMIAFGVLILIYPWLLMYLLATMLIGSGASLLLGSFAGPRGPRSDYSARDVEVEILRGPPDGN